MKYRKISRNHIHALMIAEAASPVMVLTYGLAIHVTGFQARVYAELAMVVGSDTPAMSSVV